ncbi:hypothetical protein Gotur_029945 [Gossypium turneri]|uniref:Uncharacterized protein n=1 Tax=Gossypium armourianum TaxID=34283 RepID=A0A7J9IKB2_9ROSI|nr:hypothetical protein [Gossypium armourianum]
MGSPYIFITSIIMRYAISYSHETIKEYTKNGPKLSIIQNPQKTQNIKNTALCQLHTKMSRYTSGINITYQRNSRTNG